MSFSGLLYQLLTKFCVDANLRSQCVALDIVCAVCLHSRVHFIFSLYEPPTFLVSHCFLNMISVGYSIHKRISKYWRITQIDFCWKSIAQSMRPRKMRPITSLISVRTLFHTSIRLPRATCTKLEHEWRQAIAGRSNRKWFTRGLAKSSKSLHWFCLSWTRLLLHRPSLESQILAKLPCLK